MSLILSFVCHFCQLSFENEESNKDLIKHYDVFQYVNYSFPKNTEVAFLPKIMIKVKKKFKKSNEWALKQINFLIDNEYLIVTEPDYVKINVLGNSIRKSIYEIICNYPGIYGNAIKNNLNIAVGQTLFHLEILKEYNMIQEYRFGNLRCYGDLESKEEEIKIGAIILKDSIRKLLYHPLNSPIPLKINELSKKTKIKRTTLNYCLKKLEKNKIINKMKESRSNTFIISDKKKHLVADAIKNYSTLIKNT